MEKKSGSKIIYILAFLAAVFFAAYVLSVFGDDYMAVIGAGVVMLIAAYFLVLRIEKDIVKKYELDKNQFDEVSDHIDKRCDEMEKIQKAIYMATKKGSINIENKLEDLTGKLAELEVSISGFKANESDSNQKERRKEQIFLVEKLLKEQKKFVKTIVEYNKENAKQLAINSNENAEKLVDGIEQSLKDLKGELQGLISRDTDELDKKYSNFSDVFVDNTITISERLEEVAEKTEECMEDIQDNLKKIKMLLSDNSTEPLSDKNRNASLDDSGNSEIDSVLQPNIDINRGDDTIVDGEGETEEIPTTVSQENSETISIPTADIESNIQHAADFPEINDAIPEQETEQEKNPVVQDPIAEESIKKEVPILDVNKNPNQTLSAEEIAALFASIGQ